MISAASFFRFSGLALIGATPRSMMAAQVLGGLKSIGCTGHVACINPNAEAVGDVPGYASLGDVPFPVDAAVIVVRADRVPGVLVAVISLRRWLRRRREPTPASTLLDVLAADGGYDVVASRVTVLSDGTIESALAHGRIVAAAVERHPGMLFTVLGRSSDAINPLWQSFCADTGVTYLQGYRRGVGALANLAAYRRFLASRSPRSAYPPGAETRDRS